METGFCVRKPFSDVAGSEVLRFYAEVVFQRVVLSFDRVWHTGDTGFNFCATCETWLCCENFKRADFDFSSKVPVTLPVPGYVCSSVTVFE